MKRILVTTDLSVNSKAGLRFAIQLASQNNYKLTFFHVYHIMKPTKWNEVTLKSFENSEYTKIINKLHKFVGSLYDSSDPSKEESECIAKSGISTAQSIMQYAAENNYDYVCISRKGIGMSNKFFGSNITKLINKSKVPVIAVPNNYKRTPIKKITYASDLTNFDKELKQVTDFTESLNVQIELLHYKVPIDYLMLSDQSEKIIQKLEDNHINFHFERLNYEETLIDNINKTLKRSRPSLLIMFTNQNRTLFEKLFFSSISAEYSLISKVPLLIFKKD